MKPDTISKSQELLKESQQEIFPYEFNALGLKLLIEKGVFSPKHFNGWKFFTPNIRDFKGKDILEIGCGSGITGLYLAKNGARHVEVSDINKKAWINTLENAVRNNIENISARESDIFSRFKEDEKFDIIYWNSPFIVGEDNHEYGSDLEKSVIDPGYGLCERFFSEAKQHLKPKGRIVYGMGTIGDVTRFKSIAENHDWVHRLIAKESVDYEVYDFELQLYELRPELKRVFPVTSESGELTDLFEYHSKGKHTLKGKVLNHPPIILNPGKKDMSFRLTEFAPPEANAYIVGSSTLISHKGELHQADDNKQDHYFPNVFACYQYVRVNDAK